MNTALPPLPVHLFSVENHHRMIAAGILTEDDRVELPEGWLIRKMSRKPSHGVTLGKTARQIGNAVPANRHLRIQMAVTTDDSEPEPDIAVVIGTEDDYIDHHPMVAETVLVIEVSDSTLATDRTVKQRIYARASFAIYRIVNLPDRQVEVYTLPIDEHGEPRYQKRLDYSETDSVPSAFQGVPVTIIPVSAMLPSA